MASEVNVIKPQKHEELIKILQVAKEARRNIYVITSDAIPQRDNCNYDCAIISLVDLERRILVNNDAGTVCVGVAVPLEKFRRSLKSHGFHIPSLPSNIEGTIGGELDLCHHNSGHNVGILSSYIEQMEVLNTLGDVITLTKDSDLLRATSTGLGLAGIALSATFRTEQLQPLQVNRYKIDLQQLLENFEVHSTASDYFSVTWFPTIGCSVTHAKHGNTCIAKSKHSILRRFVYMVTENMMSLFGWLFRSSRMVRSLNRLLFYLGYTKMESYINHSGNPLYLYPSTRFYQTEEWFIPRSLVPVAVWDIESVLQKRKMPIHRIDIHLVKSDDLCLSPASGRDSAAIKVSVNRSMEGEVFTFMNTLLQQYQALRPLNTDSSHKDILAYPGYDKFVECRHRLDPCRLLVSPFSRLLDRPR